MLKDKNILITGSQGFLGSSILDRFMSFGNYKTLYLAHHKDYDLTTEQDVKKLYRDFKPDIVFSLAALVGGIGFNQEHPGDLFYDNIMIGTLMMEYARRSGVEKFIGLASICAYPVNTEVPFKEEDLWKGYPESTNAPYGLAKKMLLVQSQAYRQQYNFNSVVLFMVNLYGEKDCFDPERSHVIAALIKKFVGAKDDNLSEVIVWGSGNPTREFLYVEDAVDGILLATEHYNKSDPINLGSGFEISIKDLAYMIADIVNYKGNIVFDPSKPDGQPRRLLSVEKAEREFGFRAKTDFRIGLERTINWYKESK